MFFDKESYCVEYVEQNCWSCEKVQGPRQILV